MRFWRNNFWKSCNWLKRTKLGCLVDRKRKRIPIRSTGCFSALPAHCTQCTAVEQVKDDIYAMVRRCWGRVNFQWWDELTFYIGTIGGEGFAPAEIVLHPLHWWGRRQVRKGKQCHGRSYYVVGDKSGRRSRWVQDQSNKDDFEASVVHCPLSI